MASKPEDATKPNGNGNGDKPPHWTFPRTMKRGAFRGRRFETNAEYQMALNELKRQNDSTTTMPKPVISDDYHFILQMKAGSLEMTFSGDPRRPADVDQLVDILAAYIKGQ
jgi:hypothetical protein